jgi:hypothetical protein
MSTEEQPDLPLPRYGGLPVGKYEVGFLLTVKSQYSGINL